MATLYALTAKSIAIACRNFLPPALDEIIVSGGGARNPVLINMLTNAVHPTQVLISDDIGLPRAAKECIAFALLSYET